MTQETRENNEHRETREASRGGIKFFSGTPLPDHQQLIRAYRTISVENLRDTPEIVRSVWRPEETLEAARLYFERNRLNVEGGPQWGKGTILYGLSEICHRFGWGYLFIDAHHQETPPETVISAIKQANSKNIPILYDAFDHNFGGASVQSGGIREISKIKQAERTGQIVNTLDGVRVPVAITSHDEEWADAFLDNELKNQFKEQLERYPLYRLPLHLTSVASICRFLTDNAVPTEYADYLTSLKDNQKAVSMLVDSYGDKNTVQTIFDAISSYPVLKELVRPWTPDKVIASGRKEEVDILLPQCVKGDREALISLSHIIREADKKRVLLTHLRRTQRAERRYLRQMGAFHNLYSTTTP